MNNTPLTLKTWFSIALLLLLACASQAQVTTVNLTIESVPPTVTDIRLAPEISLHPTQDTIVSCNATISDVNGIKNIVETTGLFWSIENSSENAADDPTRHYTTSEFTITETNITSGAASVSFTVKPEAVGGLWYCKITALDAANLTADNITSTRIFPQSCSNGVLDAGEELADCGGVCPACFVITPVDVSIERGGFLNTSTVIKYASSLESTIVNASASNLTMVSENASGGGDAVIDSSNIKPAQRLYMESAGEYDFPIEITIPDDALIGDYAGNITIETDTGAVEEIPVHLKVAMPNFPPEILAINVTEPIILAEEESVQFSCNATVYDINGFDDIKRIEYNVSHSSGDTGDLKFLGYSTSRKTDNTINARGRFEIGPDAPEGEWTCTVTAIDNQNTSDEKSRVFEVYFYACENKIRDEGEDLIDCGGDCPPCMKGPDIDVKLEEGEEVTAESYLESRTSQEIRVTKFNATNLTSNNTDSMIEGDRISVNPTGFILRGGKRERFSVRINVPTGLDKGEYTGNLTVVTEEGVEVNLTISGCLSDRGRGYMIVEVLNETDEIEIYVIDECTKNPIENVIVRILLEGKPHKELMTEENGRTQFTPKKAGRYTVVADKKGYAREYAEFNVSAESIKPTCDDGIQNQGEEGVDCGRPCPPCHCLNGIQDADEEGVDCGGAECIQCPEIITIPKLVIKHPQKADVNSIVVIQVSDDRGRDTEAVLEIEDPRGAVIEYKTDRSGRYGLNVSIPGEWKIKASRGGYEPAESTLTAIAPITYKRAGSYLMLILFAAWAAWYVKKSRKLVVADTETIKKLIKNERMDKYRRIYTTRNLMDKNEEELKSSKVKSVRLSADDETRANTLAEDYGITYETAELLTLCKKIKAKKFLTDADIPYELRSKMKSVTIIPAVEDFS